MSTKIILLSLLLISSAYTGRTQNFEGKITYKNTYKSKLPNLNDEQFTAMLGYKQEYLFKDGNFKSVSNGNFFQWQIYVLKDNKLYNKLANSETLFWMDAAINNDVVIKTELTRGAVTVLGHTCDEVVLTCKSGVQKYYFSSTLAVDPALFTNFRYQNWSTFISQAKALPLKMSIENQQFTMESIAIEVTAMKLDDSLFVLPANAKIEKSPY